MKQENENTKNKLNSKEDEIKKQTNRTQFKACSIRS